MMLTHGAEMPLIGAMWTHTASASQVKAFLLAGLLSIVMVWHRVTQHRNLTKPNIQ